MSDYPSRRKQLRKIGRFLLIAPPVLGLFLGAIVCFLGACVAFVGLCCLFAVLCCVFAVVAVVFGSPVLALVVLTALLGFINPEAGRRLRDWRRQHTERLGNRIDAGVEWVLSGADHVFDGADRVFGSADWLVDRLDAFVS